MAFEFKKIGERTVEGKDQQGNIVLYTQCFTNAGNLPISDADVDNDVYIKMDYAYYKKNNIAVAVIPDPTFTDDSFDI